MDLLIAPAMILVASLLYFLPSILAAKGGHERFRLIMLINVLLGWTIVGWLASLIWAVMGSSMKTCPDCAERIKTEARVCRYCGNSFR
ncbi:superinfection immunity protein [Ferrimonas aestuarii]|uniref:Superinfection immunity protein n=1 Tax=Ferrimonas aestuarii TaxID=2569539 RepID=A0A4U1BNM3_9GAMM|nr:superinfection immunity protein [Ferrimonas aestuarii]TKB53372.1 superinfection immunity protein [Ferrimonas aestuarii]